MSEFAIRVKQLNEYVHRRLDNDAFLNEIWVEGEVDAVSKRPPDRAFFDLKDEGAVVSCVSFRFAADGLSKIVESGKHVLVKGRIGLFVNRGTFRINVTEAKLAGEGDLQAQFIRLYESLASEGLFSEERKRPLPSYPEEIAVITSGSGAARRDIENVAARRNPSVRIRLYPVLVQGTGAPDSIVRALDEVMRDNSADIVIIARGGGSATDLAAFNDERVVRAVANSTIPLISAVGHETDTTLCDLVADRRASTPSVAAEIAVPEAEAIRAEVRGLISNIQRSVRALYERTYMFLKTEQADLRAAGTDHRIQIIRQQIGQLLKEQENTVRTAFRKLQSEFSTETHTLLALDPTRILSSGYAVVIKDGIRVSSAHEIHPGDTLQLMFKDGTITAKAQ